MPVSLTQLDTFRELAVDENFTRVAERLHLTQPAVSQQVRALQEHYRVKLVDVVGRRAVLTDAGRFLAARSTVVLGNVAALEREMREFADARAGELRIGATLTIGAYALPAYVARFRTGHPDIGLSVIVENTEAIVHALKSGRASLGLIEGAVDDAELSIATYARDELVLITARNHAFAARRQRVPARELAHESFVAREAGSGTRDQVETALREADIVPRVVLALPTGEGIVRAVALGIGIAIVSRLVVEEAVRDGRVACVPLRGLNLSRELRVARLRGHTQSPASRAFEASLSA